MERREKRLWIRALCGRKDAYRMLGVRYLKRGTDRRDRKLAKLCLEKAMELGEIEGAMSSLSIVVAGIMTVVSICVFVRFL